MIKINLKKIIGNAETLKQAFDRLRGMEILQDDHLGSSYIPVETRNEFVILEDNERRIQVLHPYGTSIAYYVNNEHPKTTQPE